MSIVASAGYTQYSSVLITPLFGDRLIARAYCEFVAGDITNTDYNGDITKHGDRITYFIEPEVEVHDYQKNARLQPQELESETVTMVIDRAKYYNVKLDRVDEKQIQFIDKWVEAFLQRASYNVKLQIDPDVLMRMALQTAPFNKGMNAGKQSQSQQLGEVGNPVPITAANVIEVLTRLRIVLREACRWQDGQMFIVLPEAAEAALMGSDLKAAYLTGMAQSPILNGKFPMQVMGFTLYFSNNVPSVLDVATNTNAYWVVAGNKKATGFAQQLEEHEIVSMDDTFGKYYRGLWVYGHKPFLRDALAALYCRF
ncbi:hypothetical protein [Burkholderia cenocepacia]|uniref:hypothetical protein n=1 Tax=Burkholderia cenocepacia TaxID=95486 RepID=UPI001BAE458E|nr:hypothetical protein [Burkholderia cenocepacia]MEB2499540.1 hypothetical protein [Burkholderia cenocepacia]MEB2557215.1 hypothetical protein [Burkholderia cenocepacia]QUO23834.1 hypothetical protein KEH57_09545 [Burkholderia cenocepacia]QUO26146.1 hypothetical protein KEH57_04245 [Burkholderia cenocepacia]